MILAFISCQQSKREDYTILVGVLHASLAIGSKRAVRVREYGYHDEN